MKCNWCGREIHNGFVSDKSFGGVAFGRIFCSEKCKVQYLESKRTKEATEDSGGCLSTVVRWIIIILVVIIAIAIMKSL